MTYLRASAVVFAVFVTACPSFESQRDLHVRNVLTQYASSSLRDSTLLADDSKEFAVPDAAVQFGRDVTVGDVLALVRETASQSNVPEQRLTFREFVLFIANVLSRGTKFHGKVQLNQVPRPDYLNLYILDREPRRLVPAFAGNCTYIGYQNAVLCDASFIEQKLDEFSSIGTNFNILISEFEPGRYKSFEVHMTQHMPTVRSLLKQNFLTWLIGHEIGHAVKHEQLLKRRAGAANLQSVEREADMFVATSILRNPALGNQFFVILGELLQHEYRREYLTRTPLADISEVNDRRFVAKTMLHLRSSPGRVPLLVRGLRVADACSAIDPAVKTRAYLGTIGRQIVFIQPLNDEFATFLTSHVRVIEEGNGIWPRDHTVGIAVAIGAILIVFTTIAVLGRRRQH